jgi:hypothetical protein
VRIRSRGKGWLTQPIECGRQIGNAFYSKPQWHPVAPNFSASSPRPGTPKRRSGEGCHPSSSRPACGSEIAFLAPTTARIRDHLNRQLVFYCDVMQRLIMSLLPILVVIYSVTRRPHRLTHFECSVGNHRGGLDDNANRSLALVPRAYRPLQCYLPCVAGIGNGMSKIQKDS